MNIKIKHFFFLPANSILYAPLLIIAILINNPTFAETFQNNSIRLETLSVSISNGNDDVEEKQKKGTIYFDSSDLELIYESGFYYYDDDDNYYYYRGQKKQTVGLRFNGINIPQGALIESAYIEFTVDETGSENTKLKIFGHDVDNAPIFRSSRYDVSSRNRTSAKVVWRPEAWSTIDAEKQTPDLIDIVQEIVDRPGWLANNSMAFIIKGKKKNRRVANSYEGSADGAPKLVITYEAEAGSVLPVIELTADVIVDEPKNPGTFHLVSDNYPQDTGILDMGIEFRGGTSQAFEKKSFSIEIVEPDDPDDEMNVTLLDLRKDGDWIMDASYIDTSLVRNIIGHDIFNDMRPFAFIDENGEQKGQGTIRGHLSEVYLNNTYHGVYVLEEKVDRKLLDLKKISTPEDANGNKLFDQIDFSDPENGTVLYKASSNFATLGNLATARTDFEQKYPKISDIARWEPLEELISFITTTSDQAFINNIENIIEMDSVVDYWLLMHIIADADSFKKNYYIARSGAGRFFLVPWDNDASFGIFWNGAELEALITFLQFNENILMKRLIELPQTGFNTKVKQRWNELRNTMITSQAITARFEKYHSLLDVKDENGESARDRNLARWPGSGNEGSNNPELGTAEYINDWMILRLEFLDFQIDNLPE